MIEFRNCVTTNTNLQRFASTLENDVTDYCEKLIANGATMTEVYAAEAYLMNSVSIGAAQARSEYFARNKN